MEILNKNQRDSAFWRLLALFSTVLVLLAIIATALVRPFRQAPKKVSLLEQQVKALQTDKTGLADKLKKTEADLQANRKAQQDQAQAVNISKTDAEKAAMELAKREAEARIKVSESEARRNEAEARKALQPSAAPVTK
jgi:phage shock protein A